MDFRLQRKKKEQKKWPVVVTALLTTVAAIVLTTILIVYKDDIHSPWLDKEHYIPKSGQGEGATGGENNNNLKQHERVEDKTKWLKYTKWKEDREDYKDNTFVQMVSMYKELANVSDCYICTHLPTTSQEKINYTQMPLTAFVACNILDNMLGGNLKEMRTRKREKERIRENINIGEMRRKRDDYGLEDEPYVGNMQEQLVERVSNKLKEEDRRRRKKCRRLDPKKGEENLWNAFTTERGKGYTERDYGSEQRIPCLAIDAEIKAPSCFKYSRGNADTSKNGIDVGHSICNTTLSLDYKRNDTTGLSIGLTPPKGIFIICGTSAFFKLPAGWQGTCYLAFVLPKMAYRTELQKGEKRTLGGVRRKRTPTWVNEVIAIEGIIVMPLGIAHSQYEIHRLAELVEGLASNTAAALGNITGELTDMRAVVIQNRLALDTILAKE
ncbi:neuromedin-S isoform X1 [Pleurodeles waltl]|uniref:neuromedin-S isoform X1 n=1 Tax=Pleurodeles waltl TaxID=8319 RepID=UPI00370961FF